MYDVVSVKWDGDRRRDVGSGRWPRLRVVLGQIKRGLDPTMKFGWSWVDGVTFNLYGDYRWAPSTRRLTFDPN